ncbi:barstar family protein [Saccharomonospora cyanea]|uniref:Barstar, RNAse (Barnase) inhibitor n=1 Tax=Saccharomonospora cyanea NA-134 TaxID=882082 RepID=H5XPR9_9PSEU|nr:barstar family protein [Saccharomonospora cyanea]EHR61147.1 Barstar, RNAse (barnase) inhibitor [Saccharomonospora cyanea NA-134]
MGVVVLDGRKIRTLWDFHSRMSEVLDFGPYYGSNFDALWDRLCRDVERPVHVRWEHASRSRSALGGESFSKIVNIFNDLAQEEEHLDPSERFTFEILE